MTSYRLQLQHSFRIEALRFLQPVLVQLLLIVVRHFCQIWKFAQILYYKTKKTSALIATSHSLLPHITQNTLLHSLRNYPTHLFDHFPLYRKKALKKKIYISTSTRSYPLKKKSRPRHRSTVDRSIRARACDDADDNIGSRDRASG